MANEVVSSMGLPVGEVLNIKKIEFKPQKEHEDGKRLCIVTGIHGDELEGQYIVYKLISRIKQQKEKLTGFLDIYPCANPLGVEAIERGVPTFDLDMNSCFPGNLGGDMMEHIAAEMIDDIMGTDLCIDLHSSNIFIREIPQVRLSEKNINLLKYGQKLNVDFIWAYESPTVLKSTLVHSLNNLGVPALALEMGVGMRITQEYGDQIVDGIFCLMKEMNIWEGETIVPRDPIISRDGEVEYIHAGVSGVFLPKVGHCHTIEEGNLIGEIVNPYTGKVEEVIKAPCNGLVFSLREYPIVYEGSLIARVLGGIKS